MVPAELSARGSEPEPSFEEDVGYRFDFAPAAAFAGGRR
jgi:hypothetical protein